MMENTTCTLLCVKTVPKKSTNFLISRIQERYQHNWLVDSLPAARLVVDPRRTNTTFYSIGFDLGTRDEAAVRHSRGILLMRSAECAASAEPLFREPPAAQQPLCDLGAVPSIRNGPD